MNTRLVALGLLFCSELLGAAPTRIPASKIARIEQIVSTEMARNSIPGINVAIGFGTGVAWANGYGLADLENQVPVTAHTAIRLASISKPITATAVLQLVERGRIQLDAPVQDYVPQFPSKPWPVTVRQLLGHLGGIRHYRDDEISSVRHYSDRVAPLIVFSNDALVDEPGVKYNYSTYGFNLLGAAVEIVSGMPFVDYLRTNVFCRAGMDEIRDDDSYSIVPHRSRGYALSSDGRLLNCGLADTSNKIPGGGLIGPASDLVRFGLAVLDGKLVSPETADLMLTSQTTRDGRSTGYGMGFSTGLFNGHRFAPHSGGQQGTSTYLILFPAERIAVSVMLNLESAPAAAIAQRIAVVVLEP